MYSLFGIKSAGRERISWMLKGDEKSTGDLQNLSIMTTSSFANLKHSLPD
jgi:hypothetical protein